MHGRMFPFCALSSFKYPVHRPLPWECAHGCHLIAILLLSLAVPPCTMLRPQFKLPAQWFAELEPG